MKRRIIALSAITILALSLTSCGSNTAQPANNAQVSEDKPEETVNTEEDYKNQCTDVTYESLARNNDLVDKDVHLTVKLGETSDNGSDLIGGFAYFMDDYGYETNEILVLLPYEPDGDRPLTDDVIEIWGKYKGMTGETAFMSMTSAEPYVEAEYYTISSLEDSGYAITDYVELNNTSLQIGDYEFGEDDEGYPAVIVHFTFTNNSDIPISSNSVYTVSGYQNGTSVYEYSPQDENLIGSRFQDVDPSESLSYDVYYRYDTSTNSPVSIDVYTQESAQTIATKTIEIQP